MSGLSQWLHLIADSCGKGVADNIDARALGRAADEIDKIAASHARLLAEAKEVEEAWGSGSKSKLDAAMEPLQAAIAAAEKLKT